MKKNNKIKIRYSQLLFIVTSLLAVFFLLTASFSTFLRQNVYLLSESKSKIQGEFNQKYQTISERFKKASNVCDYVNSILPDLWELEQRVNNTIPYIEEYDSIKTQLTKTASYSSFITEIIVVSESFAIAGANNRGVIYKYGQDTMASLSDEYEKSAEGAANTQFVRVFYPDSESQVGFIGGEYGLQKPMYKDGELAGWIIVIIDESIFEGFSDEKIIYLNEKGNKIYGDESIYISYNSIIDYSQQDNQNADLDIYETRNQFVMKKQIPQTQLTIAMVSDTGQTNEFSNYLPIVAAALISLILAVLLSKVASNQITGPLRNLKRNVENYSLHNPTEIEDSSYSKKNERKISFRESILMYLIVVLFLPSALFVFSSYALSLNNLNKRIQESYMTSVEGVVNNINVYMEDKEKILRIVIYDSIVQDRLSGGEADKDLELNISRAMKMGGYKNPVQIYNTDYRMIYSNDASDAGYLLQPDELLEIISKRKIYRWNSTELNSYTDYEFSILVKINSLENFANIGYLKSWIPESELENIYENLSQAGISINIIDQNNSIVSSENKELIGTLYTDNSDPELEEHMYPLNYGNWSLAAKYSKSISAVTKNSLILDRLYLTLLILLLTIAVAFVISLYMTKWITMINKLIKKTRLGGQSVDFPENYVVYEFAELSKSFNEMINANKELAGQIVETTKLAVELEEQGKKAELKALQFQINSHFIYNTFDGIVWLIKSGKDTSAVRMLTYLSKFLRYVARTDSPIVKVKEEIDHVKNYVSLINMRFKQQIQFYWDIDKNVLDYQIIRLSLQPIIENAIFHGIYPIDGIGIVEISCRKDEDSLYISITDDGCGIDDLRLQELIKNINAQDTRNSIGLHNIQSRIKLYFGGEYGIQIVSKANAGTSVTIKLPLRIFKENDVLATEPQNN